MNYGLPYMGSKNSIAHIIIDVLPKTDNFYDLFCGGCSITHCAILSKKWKNIHFNDIDAGMPQLFFDAIKGKYKNEKRWISREDFNRLKDKDTYVKIVWSFGNKGTNYLYSKEIEPYKEAWWKAIFEDDFSLFYNLGIKIKKVQAKTFKEKRLAIKNEIKSYCEKNKKLFKGQSLEHLERIQSLEHLERIQSLQSLEALERIQSLQSLEALERMERVQSLEAHTGSYDNVKIEENSIVYCDIPYESTAEYSCGSFNHKKFYDWAENQKELVVISSYNISDNRFQRVVNLKKNSNLQGGSGETKNEGLFIPKKQIPLWNKLTGKHIKEI